MQLPQRLVEDYAGCGGEVQTADFRGWHGNGKGARRITFADGRRQAARFVTKKNAVLLGELRLRVRRMLARFDADDVLGADRRLEIPESLVHAEFDSVPVVDTRSLERTIVEAKGTLPNQVKHGPGRSA